MKITVNYNSPEVQYLEKISGNDPGLYIDKDGDIWIVGVSGNLEYVIEKGESRTVMRSCERKLPSYKIRRLSPESSITLKN